jgi:hypothetical protein
MSDVYTNSTGNAPTGVSINDTRRIFNFGERVAELAPAQSPFFVYLSKVAKKSTDDPVFKFMERRHQWQRRNFEVETEVILTVNNKGTALLDTEGDDIVLDCGYNKYGKTQALSAPRFLLPGQVIAIEDSDGNVRRMKIDTTPVVGGTDGTDGITTIGITGGAGVSLVGTWKADETVTFEEDAKGQVIGSAWAEGSTDPDGWKDAISTNEGYCQIFKTAISMFSGTALATRYRGVANEYKRVWQEKLMEHKMDIEHAMLFGVGTANGTDDAGSDNIRYSWGILPYTEQFGNTYDFTYADSGYDAFLDTMENFFAPETGNSGSKLVLASRKVITFLNKLGTNGFLDNTVGAERYRLDVTNIPGSFGHNVTKINTIYGDLHFVAEPLLRGLWEDYAIAIDLKNVAYRPLIGNGVSRDTHIITNVQNNNVDGRKDIIMTEAGLEISLPETHAILKFS